MAELLARQNTEITEGNFDSSDVDVKIPNPDPVANAIEGSGACPMSTVGYLVHDAASVAHW
jgi:hypothetical protein